MGPQRRLGIYVGFDSPSIIRYLEPLTGDIFRARFADCHFDETIFPLLGEEKSVPKEQGKLVHEEQRELSWAVPTLSHLDPRTTQCENEVRRIVHLQRIANQMPDAFNDATKIEHSADGTLVHQSNYTEKVLKRFGMDKAHPLSTPMVVRSLDTKKDPYRPKGDDEMVLGPEVPYLSAIGALMYLAQCTRPDIAFSVNLLARYSSAPTSRHWTGIKHILRYLRGTTDMGLFYSSELTDAPSIVGYADAGYLSDPHQGRSQTGYVFTCGGTAISWRSTKQTLVATSSNHSEILALHEASRE
ncbi:unnamed protein product, partial [Prunus brigantina]